MVKYAWASAIVNTMTSILDKLTDQDWFENLPRGQRELLAQSVFLIKDVQTHKADFYDYSFVIMPAAKAYEGFVKDLVFGLGLISKKRYEGKRFRVGKALNPEMSRHNPDGFEILYDDLERVCQNPLIPKTLWQTWIDCRNRTFHYFVHNSIQVSLPHAIEKVEQIMAAIQMATRGCPVFYKN